MIEWGDYGKAYKAIHDAIISNLATAPQGKKITKIEFTYDTDKDIETIKFYEDTTLLFTLTFGYDGDKNVTSITRS